MSGLEPVASAVAAELLKGFILSLFPYVSNTRKTSPTNSQVENVLNELASKISQVRYVKTLWQVDKLVDLADFYCDPHVIIAGRRCKIADVEELRSQQGVVIKGIAGQGKSTFLRFLCAREMQKGIKLPVFLELRRLEDSVNLLDLIVNYIDSLGLQVDKNCLEKLGKDSKILFFLDGFDEVPSNIKPRTIEQIEDLIRLCSPSQVIISARPESGIEFSNLVQVVKLDNLRDDEYKKVIYTLAHHADDVQHLISQVESHEDRIEDLLITPLLVTLLVITYKSYQEIPHALSGFYDALYQVLLKRHDGTKPAFKRERACTINDADHRALFDAFCFETKSHDRLWFTYQEIMQFAQQAINRKSASTNANEYIDDIVRVTCLLVRDGEEYRFIHKSVQEFFAASYIASRPENVAKTFYDNFKIAENSNWQAELDFLKELDKYSYVKYYRVPRLKFLIMTLSLQKPITESRYRQAIRIILSSFRLSIEHERTADGFGLHISLYYFEFINWGRFFDIDRTKIPEDKLEIAAEDSNPKFFYTVKLSELLDVPEFTDWLSEIVRPGIDKILAEFEALESWLNSAESEKLLLQIPDQ